MSLLLSLPGILQQQGAGAAFNPETDITWHSLFWAEGTDFVAEGYSDTDPVDPWPNETGESNATQATGSNRPAYDASHASFNNQPVVFFDGNDNVRSADFSVAPDYTSGVSIVIVGGVTGAVGGTFVGGNDASNRNVVYSGLNVTYKWTLYAGTVRQGSNSGTDPHLIVAQFDGAGGNDTLTIDGVGEIDASAGAQTLDGITLGSNYAGTAALTGNVAFVGIYEGDVTADGSWADFTAWVDSHYGITQP